MIVGSIKENTALEKRVSLTPESAKNIIGLGLKVCVEKGYAHHPARSRIYRWSGGGNFRTRWPSLWNRQIPDFPNRW